MLSDPTVTRVRCDIPSELDNLTNTYKPCASNSATLDLDAYFENGTTCTAAGFGQLLSPSLAPPMPAISYAMAGGGGTAGSIQVGMPTSECQVDVSWSGSVAANGTINQQFQILTSTGKKLFMRIHFAWEDACTRPMRCYLAPDTGPALSPDNIWACAR